VGGRGGFEEEVEGGCGRMTDEAAAAPSKRRRSQKRDMATMNNDDDHQYTTINQNTVEVGGRRRRWRRRWWRRSEEVAEYIGVGKKIMRNRAHAEALAIFYLMRKWREIRREERWWRGGELMFF
jgi:hypothetical protein